LLMEKARLRYLAPAVPLRHAILTTPPLFQS
jgi:hypothetical protein